ncbi:MAG: hypothetical protein K1W10_08795 [Lachnospiraceae bacterium]
MQIDSFCRYIIQQDINRIALDLREAHKDDFFSVPEDNPLKGLLQAADEAASPDGDPEKAPLVFICKRLRLNYGKLSGEDKAALIRLAGKSNPAAGTEVKKQICILGGYYVQ